MEVVIQKALWGMKTAVTELNLIAKKEDVPVYKKYIAAWDQMFECSSQNGVIKMENNTVAYLGM